MNRITLFDNDYRFYPKTLFDLLREENLLSIRRLKEKKPTDEAHSLSKWKNDGGQGLCKVGEWPTPRIIATYPSSLKRLFRIPFPFFRLTSGQSCVTLRRFQSPSTLSSTRPEHLTFIIYLWALRPIYISSWESLELSAPRDQTPSPSRILSHFCI